jgi:hypothetical protein
MANNYYDATGVLVFAGQAKITPVIRALFGAFNLDETYPGENKAYIAQMSEETNAHWDSVAEHIVNQQKALGIALPEDADEDLITKWLYALGDRFGAKSDSFINMIENYDFDCDVSLDTLFELAMSFNDGHNLVAIEFEGCWRCSKPRLFEFGGNSQANTSARKCKLTSIRLKASFWVDPCAMRSPPAIWTKLAYWLGRR